MKIEIPGFTQALVKCAMKIKVEEKKRLPHKIFFTARRTYKAVSEDWLVQFR